MTDLPPSDAERATPDAEREAALDDLRPRLHAAVAEGLAGLSLPELRALASHPDDGAALTLLAGLAGRAEVWDDSDADTDADTDTTAADNAAILEGMRVAEGALPNYPSPDAPPEPPR